MRKVTFFLISFLVLLMSCSNSNSGETVIVSPSNLKITTEIVGKTNDKPDGDGSGTIIFKATASDATSYKILIDGKTLTMTKGELAYTFTNSGTNTYTVVISAYANGKSVSASTIVTVYVTGTTLAGEKATEIIKAMGTGFNLGNTFDNDQNGTSIASLKSIIDLYKAAGMKHIRIPVTWMEGVAGNTLASADGKVNFQNPRFLELKAAIDYAIQKDLYVVINTHHERWLKNNYDGSASFDTRFSTLWTDIATHFKGYSNKLIFDVLNEPEANMGTWGGAISPDSNQGISRTRQINLVGYNAIRATGGGNSSRIIMVEPNAQGNQNQISAIYPTKAELPGLGNDQYLAFQVHTYDPWSFCGETGSDSNYPGNNAITSVINKIEAYSVTIGVPVNYGECGVGRKDNPTTRDTKVVLDYYRLIKTTMLANNMSCTVWDDRGWFGLISSSDKVNYTFSNKIVTSMLAP